MTVRDYVAGIESELVSLRRELHQIPEVGLQLPNTQARLLTALEGLDLEISCGEQLTSITAVLRGKAPLRGKAQDDGERPVVLLRGDMDGLPVDEQTGLDFASSNHAMHACGHDLHMSILVGAVRALCAAADELVADVVFMFQPGEEGCDGASYMVAEGVLDAAGRRADAAYAIHVFSALEPHGQFAVRHGAMMSACDTLDVTVTGRGGHGSAPHSAADPVPAVCDMVLATQVFLSRHIDIFDPAVITVGKIVGGSIRNVIPETAHFEATVRSFSTRTQQRLFDLVPPMLENVAASHGVTAEVMMANQYPLTSNDPDQTDFVSEVIRDLFGDERHTTWEHPLAGSEDFSRVLTEVPGTFIALSAVPEGSDHETASYNHSAYATFDDQVIADGATLLAELAMRFSR